MPLGGLGQRLLIKSVEVESVIDESSDSSLTHHQSVTSLIRHNLFFGFIYFLYFCVVDPKFVTQTEIQNLEIQKLSTDSCSNPSTNPEWTKVCQQLTQSIKFLFKKCSTTISQMNGTQSSRIDFSNLNGESLWCIFETKAFYGGALAYAVLSRASKMDCACRATLEKGAEGRRKQKEEWLRWCAKFCNLLWAKYYSFQVVSQRHSYKNKLDSFWSAPPPPPLSSTFDSETNLNQNILARIASLPALSDSAELLEQVLCCESDERRDVIPNLWLKIKEDFICNESWQPSYRFTFNEEVKSIDPSVMPHSDISLSLIASSWSRIMLHQGRIFSSPVKKFEALFSSVDYGIWMHCVCDVAYEIPVTERAVMMWVWLLWQSQTLPLSLSNAMLHPPTMPPLTDDVRNAEGRLTVLQNLLGKRLITKAEFLAKRKCIIDTL